MERRCPGPKLPTRVMSEILRQDGLDVDLAEFHRVAIIHRLGCAVHVVDEYADGLWPGAVHVDSPTRLSSSLDLHTTIRAHRRVSWVGAAHKQVGVTIRIPVRDQRTRMLREARRQHVRDKSRHVGSSERFLKARQPSTPKECIHIEEEVVGVPHRRFEVEVTKLVRQDSIGIESTSVDSCSNDQCIDLHRCKRRDCVSSEREIVLIDLGPDAVHAQRLAGSQSGCTASERVEDHALFGWQ